MAVDRFYTTAPIYCKIESIMVCTLTDLWLSLFVLFVLFFIKDPFIGNDTQVYCKQAYTIVYYSWLHIYMCVHRRWLTLSRVVWVTGYRQRKGAIKVLVLKKLNSFKTEGVLSPQKYPPPLLNYSNMHVCFFSKRRQHLLTFLIINALLFILV